MRNSPVGYKPTVPFRGTYGVYQEVRIIQRGQKVISRSLPQLKLKADEILYARHTKIWISQGVDWISTASGSERSLRQRPLATARGTDSSPQSRSCCAQHIG